MPKQTKTTTTAPVTKKKASLPAPTVPVSPTTNPSAAVAVYTTPGDWRWELLWLIVPSFLAGQAWWWFLHRLFLTHGISWSMNTLWLLGGTIISFALLAGLNLIVPYMVHHRAWFPVIFILTNISVLWTFPLSLAAALALVTLVVGLWAAAEAIAREQHSRLTIDLRSTLAHVMAWTVLAASLSVALLHYDTIRSNLSPQAQLDRLVNSTVQIVERFLPRFVAGYQPNLTVDELIGQSVPKSDDIINSLANNGKLTAAEHQSLMDQLSKLGASDVSVPVSGTDRAKARQALEQALTTWRQQAVTNMRDELSKQAGFTITGDQTAHAAIVAFLMRRLGNRVVNYMNILPPLLSLSLFLALRFLSPLFEILAVAAGWGWSRALRLARVMGVGHYPTTAERLEWGSHH